MFGLFSEDGPRRDRRLLLLIFFCRVLVFVSPASEMSRIKLVTGAPQLACAECSIMLYERHLAIMTLDNPGRRNTNASLLVVLGCTLGGGRR